jgi:GAF domain-containing protein
MTWFQSIDPRKPPAYLGQENILLIFRERVLQYILLGMAGLGTIGYIAAMILLVQQQSWMPIVVYSTFYVAVLAIALNRQWQYNIRSWLLLSVLYLLGLSSLVDSGIGGDGRVFLFIFTVLSVFLLGRRVGFIALLLCMITLAGTGVLMISGQLLIPAFNLMQFTNPAIIWTVGSIIFTSLTFLTVIAANELTRDLERTIATQTRLSVDLQHEQARLEDRVSQRTHELQQSVAQLEAASRLALEINTAASLDDVLTNAVTLIRDLFGYYHAGIFLLDDRGEFALLRAATGAAGQAILRVGRRIKVGDIGIVGDVVSKGEARLTPDIQSDPFHFTDPLLPDARSELGLPLQTGAGILGVLDVLSTSPNAFNQQDIRFLQAITDQIAVAIEKARLIRQLQNNLNDIQNAYRDLVFQSWEYHLADTRKKHSYRFKQSTFENDVPESPSAQQAYASGQVMTKPEINLETGEKFTLISIPIKVRQQVIGVLDVHVDQAHATRDLINLLEATTQRMALALENARLLESINVRAERERMVSNISAQVRSATDIDSILRIAASQIGRSMGVSEVLVQLRSDKL